MTDFDKNRVQHELRKAELKIRGTSLAQLSRELGVSGTSMTLVSLRKHRSQRIENALAEALEVTVSELFADGNNKSEKEIK